MVLEPRLSGIRYEGAESRARFLAQLADLAAAAPGVELAASAEQTPFLTGGFSFGRLDTDGAGIPGAEITINHISSDYFAAAGIPILEGRGFDGDTAERETALVSRDLADRLWPRGTAVGQRIRMPGLARLNGGAWLTVVGVAGSVHTNAFGFDLGSERRDPHEIYLPWAGGGGTWATAPVRAGADGRGRGACRPAQGAGVAARSGAAGHRARHGRRGGQRPRPAAISSRRCWRRSPCSGCS